MKPRTEKRFKVSLLVACALIAAVFATLAAMAQMKQSRMQAAIEAKKAAQMEVLADLGKDLDALNANSKKTLAELQAANDQLGLPKSEYRQKEERIEEMAEAMRRANASPTP